MIPRTALNLRAEIPHEASFWLPSPAEIEDDGVIGYFDGTWNLVGVSTEDAQTVVACEQAGLLALNAIATDGPSFERYAQILDTRNPDFGCMDGEEEVMFEEMATHADLETFDLARLEIGVAGLSHALSAIGCVPAASCRGHVLDHTPWAEHPVVYAAINRPLAKWLQPLVAASSCGFGLDDNRGGLLVIQAELIVDSIDLADRILTEATGATPPPLPGQEVQAPLVTRILEQEGQPTLFDSLD